MKQLQHFSKNNPYSKVEEETKHIKISRPWDDDTFIILLDKSDDLKALDKVKLVDYLVAIYHFEEGLLEFIFAPVETDLEILERKFEFNFQGKTYDCYFDKSSKALELIGTGFQQTKSSTKTNYRELRMYNDFYTLDEQPEFIKEFYKGCEAYSFYIKGDFSMLENDFSYFLRLLNFYMEYFDRETPKIILHRKETIKDEFKIPCLTGEVNKFPASINAHNIELTVLETIDVAHKTDDIRLQFIFYYQVLEYCTYYFLDTTIKKELNQILKKPDINSKSKEYTKSIIDKLQDHYYKNKDDSVKMEKTILEFISIDDLKLELESNCEFFCEDIEFDGGLVIKKLFNKVEDLESITENLLTAIRKNIEKIRNVLVHLREQRENKVILPTPDNDVKLTPYMFIIKRIAEKIALQFE
ncbi:hypothetical protein G4D82_14130 [Flavobacterium sp. CYK-4]|uniref:hypothetical protein n=1 Tax=Flavobacterium lotistagni TaxID=2709660 RepID=UPI00140C02F5|nr:hypothetical protein [Flavobacterium lotistagni]NHM08363.1 hypothetical protein [Flavobacterium lotistagni]